MINEFEFLDSEIEKVVEIEISGKSREEIADFSKNLKTKKDWDAISLKFNSLIEKMYLQVKSELDANQTHARPFWYRRERD